MSLTLKSLILLSACPHHLFPLSQGIAAALPPFCCVPFHFAFALTLVPQCPALYKEPAALDSYCWVTGGTGRVVAAPQVGFGSWWWGGLKVGGWDSPGGWRQPGSCAWGGGEGRMDCSSGTGNVTGQQQAPPLSAVPLLFAEGPAALSPTGTMADACSSQQVAAVPRGGPVHHCWVPQSLATPQGGYAPSWGAAMVCLPCVL